MASEDDRGVPDGGGLATTMNTDERVSVQFRMLQFQLEQQAGILANIATAEARHQLHEHIHIAARIGAISTSIEEHRLQLGLPAHEDLMRRQTRDLDLNGFDAPQIDDRPSSVTLEKVGEALARMGERGRDLSNPQEIANRMILEQAGTELVHRDQFGGQADYLTLALASYIVAHYDQEVARG